MLKIRLSRTGRRNYATYRIVVGETRSKRDGKVVETIGNYNLQLKPPVLNIKKDRLQYWQEKGAQISEGLAKLLAVGKP